MTKRCKPNFIIILCDGLGYGDVQPTGSTLAVESSIILAEELERAASVGAGLHAYQDRRFDRCRDVVESSVTISGLQMEHGAPGTIAGLIKSALARLNQPF